MKDKWLSCSNRGKYLCENQDIRVDTEQQRMYTVVME